MVEKLSFDSRNNRNMKTNKKGSRGSMSNRHGKNTKVQSSFGGFGGGSNSLNWRNESPKNAVSESNNYGYNNHYVANAFYSLIGLQVEIQKKDAIVYEGILETVSNKVEFHLSHVCEKSNINGTKSEKMAKKLIFPFSDVVYCRAPNVDIEFAKRDTLLTDSAISSNTNGTYGERELVQWQPDDNNGVTFHDLGDHDPNLGWAFDDMMRVNEEEHGVKSTFDSSMSSYMTPLDKENEEEFKAQERRAEQVARAIQKDPGFKDVDNVDSGLGEEDMFSSVSRAANNYNNGSAMNPNNDGFTTFTGKNYRGGRHATQPANVVGPRLQRNHNSIRTQDGGPNHNVSPSNHQANRNHTSSPQRMQPSNPSRNNSYPQQMTPPQKHNQQPAQSYQRIEQQRVSVPGHPMQENTIPNSRVPPNEQAVALAAAAANPARPGLSYSAVAMKKDPPPPVVNNRAAPPPSTKPSAPPGLPDVVAPPVPEETPVTATLPPQPPLEQALPSAVAAPAAVAPSVDAAAPPLPSPPVSGEQVSEALAAAKQQMIQDARKKAAMGVTESTVVETAVPAPSPTAVSLVAGTVTTTTPSSGEAISTQTSSPAIPSPVRPAAANQPPPKATAPPTAIPLPSVEKTLPSQPRQSNGKADPIEKTLASLDIKSEVPAVVQALKEQRVRGEETKQPFLMKYGKVQSVAEEKKPGSYKELKEFGEQFKLEPKPKKRSPKAVEQAPKVPEVLPPKTAEGTVPDKTQEQVLPQVNSAVNSESSAQISSGLVTTSTVTVVSSISSVATTTVSSTATVSVSEDAAPSPSRKSSLNPSAKEFTLSATAKEFNPGRDSNSPFTPSPKQSPARPSSSNNTPTQHTGAVPHQPYYHGNQQGTVMIHPNGPEVISPTVQSVPHKIYARPYMPGPGGSTTIQYSIPAVPFNNNNNNGPQIIAAPQSAGFISQNPSGQQMIIIHPNEPYQPIVQPGQPGQQYYPMQQMIRCVPGHPNSSSVQQAVAAAARVPGNFQQQDGSPGYVLTAVSQHGGIVQHPSVPGGNQHQTYHPPQSPGQSSHIQTQYAITHPSPSSYLQNPQSPAQITPTQGNTGPGAFRSPSSMHSVAAGQHHPQQPFVMVTHQGQHMQTVAVPNNQSYVQGQQYGGGILQNYQTGN